MKKPYIYTFSGKRVHAFEPKTSEVGIIDIAHALAYKCRFAGHTSAFWSVADHSYITSLIVPPALALEALLHDASEAYLVDLPRPIKQHLRSQGITVFDALENGIQNVIAKKYSFNWPVHDKVMEADNVMLKTEIRDFMKPGNYLVNLSKVEALHFTLVPCTSREKSKERFLRRFYEFR